MRAQAGRPGIAISLVTKRSRDSVLAAQQRLKMRSGMGKASNSIFPIALSHLPSSALTPTSTSNLHPSRGSIS
ncbi:hypothetical protein BC828DRAFT_39781 [Blastocladiella britannica]|nr:hypothetical protein BC828DRAFT_39781 [Blastocladiella britannica]